QVITDADATAQERLAAGRAQAEQLVEDARAEADLLLHESNRSARAERDALAADVAELTRQREDISAYLAELRVVLHDEGATPDAPALAVGTEVVITDEPAGQVAADDEIDAPAPGQAETPDAAERSEDAASRDAAGSAVDVAETEPPTELI